MVKNKTKPKPPWLLFATLLLLISGSCTTLYWPCRSIEYYSIRPTVVKDISSKDLDAEIVVYTVINEKGDFDVVVENLTDDILTIDQTKSFFINRGKSTAYYDPTVRTTSNTTTTGNSSGKAFNLGGIANAFGIGGIAGSLMRATTLGGSKSESNSSTYTEVVADMPQVSIGPRGRMYMSKTFNLDLTDSSSFIWDSSLPEESKHLFSVSINYSFDNGDSWNTIVNDYFVNSHLLIIVDNQKTNEAVRSLIYKKPNAPIEPWYLLKSDRGFGYCSNSTFINYQ